MKTAETKTTSSPHLHQAGQPFFQKNGESAFFSDSQTDIQTKPFFCKQTTSPFIQTKLTIGRPGDRYEQEADAMADQVVQRLRNPRSIQTKPVPFANTVTPLVQTKCAGCEEEEQLQKKEEDEDRLANKIQRKPIFESDEPPPGEEIQRKCAECLSAEASAKEGEAEEKLQKKGEANSSAKGGFSSLESHLNSSRGSGSSLPEDTRAQMESSFGIDFSGVRIHTDGSAVQMNKDLRAQAFTHGSDIYFNSGKYNPESTEGKKLLAHELTHTVQQGHSNIQSKKQDNAREQTLLPAGKDIVQGFDIPFTDYETDFSWRGVKTAAGLTADAAKGAGRWTYNRGKFIVGNAVDCARATGSSIRKLVTGDFDSLADLLGMPKPAGDGPSMIDWISFMLTHPCLKMIPGYEAVDFVVDKFSKAGKFLKGAWHMINNPDEMMEAIHTSPFLSGMMTGISPAAMAISLKAVTHSSPAMDIVSGIWRHLMPKLEYLASNWWEILKSTAYDMLWPWPGVGKDLGVIWDELSNCVDNLWDLKVSAAVDNLLSIWRTVNNMMGRLYLWFVLASVLIGAIIGAFFGGAGAIPGALLGLKFAMAAGQFLLLSTIAAETASIGKAGYDLVFSKQTPEEKEHDFEQIANSGITLAITGILAALSALAVRFAKGVISKVAGIFTPAEKGGIAPAGGLGGGGTSGSGSGPSWTPRVIQGGGKGAPSGTGPVAQGGGGAWTGRGNAAPKLDPVPVIEPPPQPNLKVVPDPVPAVKTPGIPSNTAPVVGGLTGAQVAEKARQKAEEEKKKKKKICYRTSIILRIEGRSFVPVGAGPTPDDLRIRACVLRTATGTTDEAFTFRNIAVGRFLVNGNMEYVAAPNPEGNIHSEDEVFRLAEQRFGAGNFTLSALFTERRPCARCTGNIYQFPRTPDFRVYCIINNDYNWRQIRDNYNNGVLF
jgi:hypothetical protein